MKHPPVIYLAHRLNDGSVRWSDTPPGEPGEAQYLRTDLLKKAVHDFYPDLPGAVAGERFIEHLRHFVAGAKEAHCAEHPTND